MSICSVPWCSASSPRLEVAPFGTCCWIFRSSGLQTSLHLGRLFAALLAFFLTKGLQRRYRLLLYLDGLAAALFGLAATEKVLDLQLAAPLAVMMGVLTSIGGGIARDVLAGRVSLLMSRDIYATPILLGCTLYVALRDIFPTVWIAGWIALIFYSSA